LRAHKLCDAVAQLVLLHTLMSCCDMTYVSTLLLLLMHTHTTVGVYRITYVDALRTTNGAYGQLMLLGDRCTRYSILTGIIIDVRYAPCN
jgi:hypothetical protein